MTFPTIVFNVTATIRVINPDSSSILKKETQSFHLFPPENSKFLVSWILRYASLLHPSNKGTHPMYNTVKKKKRERIESSSVIRCTAGEKISHPTDDQQHYRNRFFSPWSFQLLGWTGQLECFPFGREKKISNWIFFLNFPRKRGENKVSELYTVSRR